MFLLFPFIGKIEPFYLEAKPTPEIRSSNLTPAHLHILHKDLYIYIYICKNERNIQDIDQKFSRRFCLA